MRRASRRVGVSVLLRGAFPWGKVAHACVRRMRGGRQMVIQCRGEACLDAPNFIRRNWRGKRLPLEGKLSQRQLRLMRSKLKIIAMSRYKLATFDLIRSGLSRTTFPSRGRLSPGPFGLMILFPGENCNTQFTVHKLPRNSLQIVHFISGKPTIIREKRKKTGGIPYGRFRIDR